MNISSDGIALIERFEGCRLNAYLDSVNVPTIGVGHTLGVKMGQTITQDQADEFLHEDCADAEFDVNTWVTVPLTQGQFDALTSFCFNLGGGALRSSTLLKLLNASDYQGASDQFPAWCRAGGVILPGLVARRAAERAMFLGGTDAPASDSWGNEAHA